MTSLTCTTSGAVPADDEADLVARIRARDERACEQLVRQYGGRMLAVARRFFPRREHDAQDAVQDAMLSAFVAINGFAGTSSLGTWLHRIVVNACLMKLRGDRRARQEASIDDLLPAFDSTGHHVVRPRESSSDALTPTEVDELGHRVRACIDQLPEPYRTVLLLRDIEERDTSETARLTRSTPGNVKTRLHRARQALRTLLDREGLCSP